MPFYLKKNMEIIEEIKRKINNLHKSKIRFERKSKQMEKDIQNIYNQLDDPNTTNPYLYNSIDDFLASDSFKGTAVPKKSRHFDQWLYIGAYHAFDIDEIIKGNPLVKFKVGYTSDIRQREVSLNSDNHYQLSIVYSWPIPNAQLFETQVFRYLKNFIHEDALPSERLIEKTEVIWSLNLGTLIKIIRLIIYKYVVLEDFVVCSQEMKLKMKNSMVLSPRGFQYKNQFFYANLMTQTSIKLEDIYAEMGIVDESYDYILTDWGYNSLDFFLSKPPVKDKVSNELNLKKGDITFGVFREDNKIIKYPLKILGFGLGPFAGFYYVQWLQYDEEFTPVIPVEPYDGPHPTKQFILPEDIRIGTGKFADSGFKLRF